MQLQVSPTPVAGALDPPADEARTPSRRDLLRVLRSRRAESVSRLMAQDRDRGLRGRITRALDAMAAGHRRVAREIESLATEIRGADRSSRRIGPILTDRATGGAIEERLQALVADLTDPGWSAETGCPRIWSLDSDGDDLHDASAATDGVPETAVIALIHRIAALTRQTAELERQVTEGTEALAHCERRLIAERREAEDRETRLIREVDHRTRNALAVVTAIVSLTRAPDIAEFTAAVERRVQALARAHGLLSDSCWRRARVADLVAGEFTALGGAHAGQIALSGDAVTLDPTAVLALALAVHELAANAARHGALSHPGGHLEVCWQERDGEFVLTWSESGAPEQPATPDGGAADGLTEGFTEGLGLRIVRASVEAQLCGRIAFERRPDGLSCTINAPVNAPVDAPSCPAPPVTADRHPRRPRRVPGR